MRTTTIGSALTMLITSISLAACQGGDKPEPTKTEAPAAKAEKKSGTKAKTNSRKPGVPLELRYVAAAGALDDAAFRAVLESALPSMGTCFPLGTKVDPFAIEVGVDEAGKVRRYLTMQEGASGAEQGRGYQCVGSTVLHAGFPKRDDGTAAYVILGPAGPKAAGAEPSSRPRNDFSTVGVTYGHAPAVHAKKQVAGRHAAIQSCFESADPKPEAVVIRLAVTPEGKVSSFGLGPGSMPDPLRGCLTDMFADFDPGTFKSRDPSVIAVILRPGGKIPEPSGSAPGAPAPRPPPGKAQ